MKLHNDDSVKRDQFWLNNSIVFSLNQESKLAEAAAASIALGQRELAGVGPSFSTFVPQETL